MTATARRMNLDPLTAFLTGIGGVLAGVSGFLIARTNRGSKRDELVIEQVNKVIETLQAGVGELQKENQDMRNRLREVESDVQKLQKDLIESQRVISRLEGEKANLEWEVKRLAGVNAEQMTEIGRLEAQLTEQKRLSRALVRRFRKFHPEEALEALEAEGLLEHTLQNEEVIPPDLEGFGE